MILQIILIGWGAVLLAFGDTPLPKACGVFMIVVNSLVLLMGH